MLERLALNIFVRFWQDPVQHVRNFGFLFIVFLTRALRSVDKDNVKAILRYAGAPAQDPVTSAISAPVALKNGGSANPLQEFQLAVRFKFDSANRGLHSLIDIDQPGCSWR
jgi:hypothetical protein